LETRDAGMNRIRFLYHYQRFDTARLERLLATNSIYLSDTKGFNDPCDCRPCFDLTRLDDPTFYQRQVEYFERVDRKRNTHLSEDGHQQRAARLRKDRSFLEHCIYQMSGIETEIQKRYRVYCLTTKPADTLMWSHYTENHTGICLEFGCANDVLSGALQVIYCDTYPLLDLADDDQGTVLLPLVTKARAWEYEEEYRLIAQEEAEALNHDSLITKNNLLLLPDGALASIIVGCVAPEATRDAVRDIVRHSGRNLDLKHAVRVPNHYNLTINDMT
jgi:Protein of unknown function (DUF2971)